MPAILDALRSLDPSLVTGLYDHIMPLLFAYTPLLHGDWPTALNIFAFALVGLYAFAAAFQGYLETGHGWPVRLLLAVVAVAMLYPNVVWLHWCGLAIFISTFAWDWRRQKAGAAAR